MNLEQYVKNAIRTESTIDEIKLNKSYEFIQALNAFTAAAILLDLFKKHIFYKKPINQEKWNYAVSLLCESSQNLQRSDHIHLEQLKTLKIDPRVFHGIVGIATEAGELIETIIKQIDTNQLDNINLAEEIGDVCWYQAILVDTLKINWDTILERNIAKLKVRYPEKYTDENAINRNIEIERKILEGQEGVIK